MNQGEPASIRLKPNFEVLVLENRGVLLLREDGARVLYGRLHERLVPLLDGAHSVEEIVSMLASEFTAEQVYLALISLRAKGYLCGAITKLNVGEAAFWSELEVEPEEAIRQIQASRVALRVIGSAIDEELMQSLVDALQTFGIVPTEEKGPADLILALCDHYLHPQLEALNQECHQQQQPWLLLRPRGRELWLGPYFNHGQPGCYACLHRLHRRHRQVELFASRLSAGVRDPGPPRIAAPSGYQIIARLAAMEVGRILAAAAPVCVNQVISLDLSDYRTTHHTIIADPECPVCGAPPKRQPQPIALSSCRINFKQDGGYRHVSAEKMLMRYGKLVSPITGIVSELRTVKSPLPSVHVVVAGDNSAQSLECFDDLRRNLRSCSAGKGASESQAKASALGEALERFCGMPHAGLARERASYLSMLSRHGDRVIHPNSVMHFSKRQYEQRRHWNELGSRFNRVPDPLDPRVAIDWTPIWSLTRQEWCYIPLQLITIGRSLSDSIGGKSSEPWIAMGCSNGNAAGNTIEEAVLQGILEIIERDSTAIWWYNRLRQPGIDLESLDDAWIGQLIKEYHSIGREVWALDLTTDLGITCVAAISRSRDTSAERILLGLGCHLDPRLAVQRALAEMNQMLVLAEDSLSPTHDAIADQETLDWLETATLANQPYLQPDLGVPLRKIEQFPNRNRDDLLLSIQECCRLVEEKRMEVLVLDQTLAMVGFPVVKVVIPGLRHFWARFAPGRLYDVPVVLEMMQRPLLEEEMNPIPIFF